MAIEEEDLDAIELCALDKKTRLLAVMKRTSTTAEAVTYVQVPFVRAESHSDRAKAARFQVLHEDCVWHPLTKVPGKCELPVGLPAPGPCVARAMVTTYRKQRSKGYVAVWCPAKSVSKGWAYIQLGVDPSASCPVANQGIIIDVHTGMQVWGGYENPTGKLVLAMLRTKHPDACSRLSFGLGDEGPTHERRVDSALVLDPLKTSLREMGAM